MKHFPSASRPPRFAGLSLEHTPAPLELRTRTLLLVALASLAAGAALGALGANWLALRDLRPAPISDLPTSISASHRGASS